MVTSKIASIQSVNPATREVLGEVPVMGQSDVEAAVEKAWKSYETWQLKDYGKKAKHIRKLRSVISKHADELAQLISSEVGKPMSESYLTELTGPLDTCTWLVDNAERLLSDQMVQLTNPLLASKQSIIAFEPLGVVGVIAPWNYPFSIPMMTILMAVMVGNTVVLKPSEKSPLIGIKIAELFTEAGFPEGVVTVVTGDRSTGEFLSKAKLSKLIFTGSVQGGSAVMAQAAARLTPVVLELGGKDAAVVLPDAPVDWTAKGLVWGAMTNAGQACASIERVYIIKGKHTDKLIAKIVEETKKLQIGNATDPKVDVGPLIDEIQLSKVAQQVEEAKDAGAKVLCGGKRRDDLGGYFFEPTVITNVDHSMRIMQEETFGPVLAIMIADNEDHAVELANDSEFGLTASVWSGKLGRAENVARDLNVGTVYINDCLFSHACPQLPWGGLKKSGFGRSHAQFGLIDLVNVKHISIDSAGGVNRLWWYPYGLPKIKMVKGGINFLHGSFFKSIGGFFSFAFNWFKKPK